MRFFCYWGIVLFSFFFFSFEGSSLYGKPPKKESATTKKKTEEIPTPIIVNFEEREIENQLQKSLQDISFSKISTDLQTAMDFLIDHPKISLSPLYNLLSNSEIKSSNLLNIWNIYHYILDDERKPLLNCTEIDSIIGTQEGKQDFLFQVIDRYLDQCQDLKMQIENWLENPSVLKYQTAFLLIQKKNLISFTPKILNIITFTKNPVKQEIGLNTLISLAPKNLDISPLLPLFSSKTALVRYKVADLFSLYENQSSLLMKQYNSSSIPLEKTSLIYALRHNSSDEVFDFIAKIYLDNPETWTEIGNFFLLQTNTPNRMKTILNLLHKASDESALINILYTISFLIPKFSENNTLLKEIEITLQKEKPKEDNMVSDLIKMINREISELLRKKNI